MHVGADEGVACFLSQQREPGEAGPEPGQVRVWGPSCLWLQRQVAAVPGLPLFPPGCRGLVLLEFEAHNLVEAGSFGSTPVPRLHSTR